ncbi:cysteine-rich receptor-like protein kinase 10 [Oryza glaberrima]|uniref:cysteine-rich receptor-like protein kinase 10 n=1 Tax=Oryza glaberrima TaxID=4538 RepID=UPI00224C2283|nr:cysteine-rich receptor-like protein kinase 10 [Oryza glaberrima]
MAYFYLAAAACLVGVFLHAPLATDAQPMPWHRCNATSGNYTANSTYHANIQYLATSLPAYASSSPSLFASGSSGAPPDAIYALALCRGDTTNASSCATCVAAAIQAAQKHTALVKTVAIYDDPCIVRFSNLVFPVSPPYNKGMFVAWDDNNVSAAAAAAFDAAFARLANATAEHAAADSVRRFATGEEAALAVAGEVYPKIYSLAQCTPDMSADACRSCLEDILVRMVPTYLAGRKGGRVLGVRCNFRFETYPFFFGQPLLQLPGSPASSSAPVNGERSKHKRSTMIGILVPAIALSSIVAWFCSWRWRRRLAARTLELIPTESSTDDMQSIGSLLLDLSTLRVATDDFSEHKRLGEGGFGVVYKGDLPKGQEIAVKRLAKTSKQGIEELKTELLLVAKLNHNNLVKLIGVCLEENEKILVYEYMPNRSLDTILFDAQKIKELNWGQRFKIINGIARGLQYLHEDSQLKIVHRDLKASNVLLDSAYNPKISDFGLAKIFERDQSKVITHRIAGTYGYMSPEYAMRGQYSIKSDVFSFGVLVLEIITGRRNFGSYGSDQQDYDLINATWEHWTSDKALELIDPSLGNHYPVDKVLKCIQIGLLCVQPKPADRPLMSAVNVMLTGTIRLPSLSRPAFWFQEIGASSDVNSEQNLLDPHNSTKMYQSEAPITELEPR